MRSIQTVGAAGAKRQRIGVVLAPEAFRADLGEAFDVVAHRHQGADALEKRCDVEGASWLVECSRMDPEAQPGDLAGAGADGHVKRGLIVDDQRFDVKADLGIMLEEKKALRAEDLRSHQGNAMPGRADALLHRVGGEERAQDDPEQLHDLDYMPAFSPAESGRLHPTNCGAMSLKSGAKLSGSPADLMWAFPADRPPFALSSRIALRASGMTGVGGVGPRSGPRLAYARWPLRSWRKRPADQLMCIVADARPARRPQGDLYFTATASEARTSAAR
jgi:hypothetical protein